MRWGSREANSFGRVVESLEAEIGVHVVDDNGDEADLDEYEDDDFDDEDDEFEDEEEEDDSFDEDDDDLDSL